MKFTKKKLSARFILVYIALITATAALSSIASPAHAAETTKLYGVIIDSAEKPISNVGV